MLAFIVLLSLAVLGSDATFFFGPALCPQVQCPPCPCTKVKPGGGGSGGVGGGLNFGGGFGGGFNFEGGVDGKVYGGGSGGGGGGGCNTGLCPQRRRAYLGDTPQQPYPRFQ